MKILRQDYATNSDSKLNNADVESMWRQEAEDLQRVDSQHVNRMLDMTAHERSSKPVIYCKKIDEYFHPPCPHTGQLLTVCRDDNLLLHSGLPEFSRSLTRYLHAGDDSDVLRFYRLPGTAREAPRENVEVRLGNQLFRDYGPAIRNDRLTGALPCQSCQHRGECYPADAKPNAAIPAEDELVPVSYYDFGMIPLELLEHDYDEYCDWLGGASWPDTKPRTASTPTEPTHEPAPNRRQPMSVGDWMFSQDRDQFWPEVLKLKLCSFLGVCQGLRAIHAQCRRPHLGVAPQNVMACVPVGGLAVPPRWNGRTYVIDLGTAYNKCEPLEPGIRSPRLLLEPSGELAGTPYECRKLRDGDGLTTRLSLTVHKTEESDGEKSVTLKADLDLDVRAIRAGDVIRIQPTNGSSTTWAEITDVTQGSLIARSDLTDEHPLASHSEGQVFEATCTMRKVLGVESDLYGLGMLLFRTLLVNDKVNLLDVHKAVGSCLRRIEIQSNNLDRERFERIVPAAMLEHREVFSQNGVLYAQTDREGDFRVADSALWTDLLTFAFRLVAHDPDTRLIATPARTRDEPASLMASVMDELRSFIDRTDAELFGEGKIREILDACERASIAAQSLLLEQAEESLNDEAQDGLPDDLPEDAQDQTIVLHQRAPAPVIQEGLRIRILKEGDAPVDRSFLQEQITIGRNDDNALTLNHAHVSSHHAIIEKADGDYCLIDRGSLNGTFLNYDDKVEGRRVLRSGDTVVLGPFALHVTFRSTASATPGTSQDRLCDDLLICFAEHRRAPESVRRDKLDKRISSSLHDLPPDEQLERLEAVKERLRPFHTSAAEPSARRPEGAKLVAAAQVELQRLAQQLDIAERITSVEGIAQFAEGVRHFLSQTLEYVKRAADVRRTVSEQLDVDQTAMSGRSSSPIESAETIGQFAEALIAGPSTPLETSTRNLDRVYQDLLAMQHGILKGSQDIVKQLLDRLDPARLEKRARAREAPGSNLLTFFRKSINDALESALWKEFRDEYSELHSRSEQDALRIVRDGIRKAHEELDDSRPKDD